MLHLDIAIEQLSAVHMILTSLTSQTMPANSPGTHIKVKTLITLAAMLLPLSSCSTMNKRECKAGEWQESGYTDALNGLTSSRFTAHAKACAKHGIESDESLYSQGYDDGLKVYCRSETGIRKGRNKNNYKGICPADLEPVFLNGYLQGLEIALGEIESDYSDTRADLRSMRFRRLRAETAEQARQIERLISTIEEEVRDLRQDLSNLRTTIAIWQQRSI